MTCNAIRQQDEMYCATCRLRWDTSDPVMCGKECPSIVPDGPVQVATRDAQERLPYASGLAPDIFSRPRK